jgi:two-component system phosphate regulon response regulator PhoB
MAKIVVCEDTPAIQKLIQMTLRTSGHDVLVADDGLDGLALIDRERPDVVLTDIAMPGLNGLELIEALQARPDLAPIPVLLITASAQRAELAEGLRHAVAGYITKPFRTADLRQTVAEVLAR